MFKRTTGIILAIYCTTSLAFKDLSEEATDLDIARLFSNPVALSEQQAESNLDEFAKQLQLTEEQLDSWYRFKITFLEQLQNRNHRRSAFRELKNKNQDLNSVDSLKLREHYIKVRLKEIQQMLEVVEALYSKLNTLQRQQFDRALSFLLLPKPFQSK